ncbi:hypothetical protein DM860_007457 [Cuscuta australis]|uniref:Uncharacterized protein n=1 Tax=Cuscuta australis TaxID=267555 RepID=A0A328E7V9_9ASTE|nr:hypothetical protein DM860_007457 [Cuscuta australis]
MDQAVLSHVGGGPLSTTSPMGPPSQSDAKCQSVKSKFPIPTTHVYALHSCNVSTMPNRDVNACFYKRWCLMLLIENHSFCNLKQGNIIDGLVEFAYIKLYGHGFGIQ